MTTPVPSSLRTLMGYRTALVLPLACGALVTTAAAHDRGYHSKPSEPFDEAFIFFELNNTDGDLGIHAKVDGGPWKGVQLYDRNYRRLMSIRTSGRLWKQGVTELFFESAEPPFDELSPETFFRRFPPGTYRVHGWSMEGKKLRSETEITHAMPAPAVAYVNGNDMVEVCDDEDEDFDESLLEIVGPDVTISWDPVVSSHPDLGVMPPVAVEIHNYEVVVETEIEVGGEEFATVFSVLLPPDQTSMTVPAEFLALSDEFKYEVLARESSYNQTAVESCFILVEP